MRRQRYNNHAIILWVLSLIRGMLQEITPLDRVFKIGKRLCKILSVFVVGKGMIKWVTPLGRVFKIGKRLCKILSVFVVDKLHG
mgnify:CR=1 FL=1